MPMCGVACWAQSTTEKSGRFDWMVEAFAYFLGLQVTLSNCSLLTEKHGNMVLWQGQSNFSLGKSKQCEPPVKKFWSRIRAGTHDTLGRVLKLVSSLFWQWPSLPSCQLVYQQIF